jgi:hypothetical protein
MAEGNGNGTARWSAWAGIGTLALALIGSLFVLYATAIGAAKDVASLSARISALETQVAADRVQITKIEDKQTEIDTQLRASIDDSNKSLAWQLRINSMLWSKAFPGSHFPTDDAFYPNIANGEAR